MILYVHGFNSSPASFKARLLQSRLAARGLGHAFAAPALPHRPRQALDLLAAEIARHPPGSMTLVGSSLGGWYATWLAERSDVRVVLLNPAVHPQRLLSGHVGRQRNLHTGEEYDFTADHVRELEEAGADAITRPQRYFLIAATGDEVLDCRDAIAFYAGARQVIVEGGDHGLSSFADHVEDVIDFAGIGPGR